MTRVEANGININYVVDGPEGAPWVTFITGITNDAAMWDDHIPALSKNFRLLRLDSRGHGDSDATPPPYSFDQLTGDVIGVWDELGVERSHVVGIGLGGMTTLALALRAPRRVSAIVPTACRAELVPEYAEINLITPVTPGAVMNGPNGWCAGGWTSPAPGSHHYPEVRDGAVISLFFLPAGRISYDIAAPAD